MMAIEPALIYVLLILVPISIHEDVSIAAYSSLQHIYMSTEPLESVYFNALLAGFQTIVREIAF
jgi:hypothetical protein